MNRFLRSIRDRRLSERDERRPNNQRKEILESSTESEEYSKSEDEDSTNSLSNFLRATFNPLPDLKVYLRDGYGCKEFSADDFEGTSITELQMEFKDMTHPVAYGLTQRLPTLYQYRYQPDPQLEYRAKCMMDEEYTRIIMEKQQWIRNQQVESFDRITDTSLELTKKSIEFGYNNHVTDQDMKIVFYNTLRPEQKRSLQNNQVDPWGKYGKFLTAERLFFIAYLIEHPISGREAVIKEYNNYRQGEFQTLSKYLDMKTQFYELTFEAYGIEDYKFYQNTLVDGLYNQVLKEEINRKLMEARRPPSKVKFMAGIIDIANVLHCKSGANHTVRTICPVMVHQLRRMVWLDHYSRDRTCRMNRGKVSRIKESVTTEVSDGETSDDYVQMNPLIAQMEHIKSNRDEDSSAEWTCEESDDGYWYDE